MRAALSGLFRWLRVGSMGGAVLAGVQLRGAIGPQAQAALDAGIAAAKKNHDYPLAIRRFEEARALVPEPRDAAPIFLNLGLAESYLPGRELRSVCWLSAYLSVRPQSSNETAVKEKIEMLCARNRANLLHLIKTVENESGQVAFPNPWIRTLAWVDIARAQCVTGDIAGAQEIFARELRTAPTISYVPGRSVAYSALAEAEAEAAVFQAGMGHLAEAKRLIDEALHSADLVEETVLSGKVYTRAHVAKFQFEAGDIVGALHTVGLIDVADRKDFAMGFQSYALARVPWTPRPIPTSISSADDTRRISAEEEAKGAADLVLRHLVRTEAYRDLQAAIDLVAEQVQAGWTTTADLRVLEAYRDSLLKDAARSAVDIDERTGGRVFSYFVGGSKVVDSGIAVADLDISPAYRTTIANAVAENIMAWIPAENQDFITRLITCGHLLNRFSQHPVARFDEIDWLERLDNANAADVCALNTAAFLDLGGYLKALPQSADSQKSFDAVADVIERLAAAQSEVDQMRQVSDLAEHMSAPAAN